MTKILVLLEYLCNPGPLDPVPLMVFLLGVIYPNYLQPPNSLSFLGLVFVIISVTATPEWQLVA